MARENKLFRKAALDRLSSPEQLDQLMEVVSPKGWLVLATFALLLGAGLTWGFVGSLPSKVSGQGILIRGGTVLDVVAGASGRIIEAGVRSGDFIEAGTVVFRLDQPEMTLRIQNVEIELAALDRQHGQLLVMEETNRELEEENLRLQRQNIEATLANFKEQIGWLGERIANQERLVAEGHIPRATLIESRNGLYQIEQQRAQAQTMLQGIAIEQLNSNKRLQQERHAREVRLEQARQHLAELTSQLDRHSNIVSPHSGRVLQVMFDLGSLVQPGVSLLTLELAEQTLEVVAYVSPESGKKIHPGMGALVSPSTVKSEEFGHILGTVKSVSAFPSTPQGMMRVLRNEALVQQLSQFGSPIEVVVGLETDPVTASGFRWSSRRGPPLEIVAGTMCFSSIVVEERKPITLVVPFLKRLVLGAGEGSGGR